MRECLAKPQTEQAEEGDVHPNQSEQSKRLRAQPSNKERDEQKRSQYRDANPS